MAKTVWITIKEVSILLCITDRRIRQLQKDGLLPSPEKQKWDMVGCVQGYIKYMQTLAHGTGSLSLTDERTRLTRINADKKQLELRKAKGELLDVNVAMGLWGKVVLSVKSKILALPTKISPTLAVCKTIPEIKKELENHIDEILNEVSSPDLKRIAKKEYAEAQSRTNEHRRKEYHKKVAKKKLEQKKITKKEK